MVGYYQAYKGSTQTPLIYAGSDQVKQVYKGSNLIYQIGFDTFTVNAGASLQSWTVPQGVSKIHIDCVASRGYGGSGIGGKGGRVECDLSVTGGQILYLTVGNIPTTAVNNAEYNASDIRIGGNTYDDRVVVAGGGGAGLGNNTWYGTGGAGGGLTGGTASGVAYQAGGFGGSQSAGGVASYRTGGNVDGWAGGSNGTLGMGGNGGYGSMYGGIVRGGAGGAGYYGGGGGSVYDINKVGISYAGGGGGSSYTNSDCIDVVHTQGHQDGDGYITISFIE